MLEEPFNINATIFADIDPATEDIAVIIVAITQDEVEEELPICLEACELGEVSFNDTGDNTLTITFPDPVF